MPPKRKLERKSAGSAAGNRGRTNSGGAVGAGTGNKASKALPASAGYLISCDVPTKKYIQHLNDEEKTQHKKFILEDLDSTHLLIAKKARPEIEKKVEQWMDANVFSAIERVGENLDMS
mmetsp:Transcript_3394/g.8177  ORF Transcript_3394/g.8177 Transcript_3394/m.8177 type:complete len:119 (-) Transcript_3394:324-680(-)